MNNGIVLASLLLLSAVAVERVCSQVGIPTTLQLHWLDSAKYPEAVCNDGSKGGFYFAASPMAAGSGLWMVHLQGGHWCWNVQTCAQRWLQYPNLMSNQNFSATKTRSGIFDSNSSLNPLAAANKVYIPYCTSDAWSGRRSASLQTGHWSFFGQKVLEAVLRTLQQDFGLRSSVGATAVALSGCSAGGRGAMANLEYLPGILQDSGLSVYGTLDSPLWVDVQPYASGQVSVAAQTEEAFHFVNASGRVVGSHCGEVHSTEMWKCLFGEYKLPLITLPFVMNGALYDSFQVLWNLGAYAYDNTLPVANFSRGMLQYTEWPLRAAIQKAVAKLTSNVVSSACFHHCTSEQVYFWNLTVAGQSYATATKRFLEAEGVLSSKPKHFEKATDNKWVGKCVGINCGDGCASIEEPY